jgi:aspartate aminotransferase
MKLSDKVNSMAMSPIRKFTPIAKNREDQGTKIYYLNIGQPDIETPSCFVDAIKNFDEDVIEYANSQGLDPLLDAIVDYFAANGMNFETEDIMVTNGGSEALSMVYNCILNPGENILVPEPYYTNYNSFAILSDAVIKTVPSTIKDGFALPSIEEFEKVITPKTKAIMICNPNNPTGYLYSKEELLLLGEIAKKHNLYLFADEVYREFCYDGKQHFSVMEMEDLSQHVILLDSVSKRYSACGARIGVIISKNKQIMNAALRMAQARLCAPYFGQIFGEAAVDTPQEYFDKVAKEYDLRRRTLIEAINKIDGCFCPMPTGAFYTILEMPIDDSDKFCQWLLEEFNYNGETVMLAPATGFYSDPEKGRKQARITYCLKIEDLKAAVKCLEEALKVYPGRTNK